MKIITNKSKRIILVGVLALILGSLAYLWIVNNSIKHMPMFASYAKGYDSIQELTDDSAVIAVIKAKEVVDEWVVSGRWPLKNVEVEVVKPILNVKLSEHLKVCQTDGIVEIKGERYHKSFPEDPLLKKGEEYLVFMRTNEDGGYTILGGPQGRFKIKKGKAYSMKYVNEEAKGYCKVDINGEEIDALTDKIKKCIVEKEKK